MKDVFHKFPSVSQLLSELISCPLLLLHDGICKKLIKCTLKFYSREPECSVGKKAASWAIVRYTEFFCKLSTELFGKLDVKL